MSFHEPIIALANNIGTTLLLRLPQLSIFLIGVLLYVLFIWMFYRTLSKRDLFKLKEYFGDSKLESLEEKILYILKYLVIFPIYTFFWFILFSLFLFILSKIPEIATILQLSFAIVSSVRITAYVNEKLSEDVAKLIPLALLAIFLTDPTFFDIDIFILRVTNLPTLQIEVFGYIVLTIAIEWILRIAYNMKSRFIKSKKVDKYTYLSTKL